MRHVADESRLACHAPHDLCPLIPARGTAVGHQPVEQLHRAIAPTHPHERADAPQLIRRVVPPLGRAVAAFEKRLPVTLERPVELTLRQTRPHAGDRETDRGGRCIEVAAVGAAGNVVDAVQRDPAVAGRALRRSSPSPTLSRPTSMRLRPTGRGGWSWYTGAAGWLYRLVLESLLGLRLERDVLHLAPCLLADW